MLSQKKPSFFPVSIYKFATIGPPAKRRCIFKWRSVGRPIVARDYIMYMLARFSFYLVDFPVYFFSFRSHHYVCMIQGITKCTVKPVLSGH